MRSLRYPLIVLLAIAPFAQSVSLAFSLFAKSSFTLLSIGIIPRDLGVAYYVQVTANAAVLVFHVAIALAVYLGEAWARTIMLGLLALGFVGASFDLLEDPGLPPVLTLIYCLLLGFVLTRPMVRSFLDSQSNKRANKAPEPTPTSVTPRAASR